MDKATFTEVITLSPSPRELFECLSDQEKVAIDLILELGSDQSTAGPRLKELIPLTSRQAYLKTLAEQLRAFGSTVIERLTLGNALDQEHIAKEHLRLKEQLPYR